MNGRLRGHGSDQVRGLGSHFWKWSNNVAVIRSKPHVEEVAFNLVGAMPVRTMDMSLSMEAILNFEGLEHFVFLSLSCS